jgi:hypothetical protein
MQRPCAVSPGQCAGRCLERVSGQHAAAGARKFPVDFILPRNAEGRLHIRHLGNGLRQLKGEAAEPAATEVEKRDVPARTETVTRSGGTDQHAFVPSAFRLICGSQSLPALVRNAAQLGLPNSLGRDARHGKGASHWISPQYPTVQILSGTGVISMATGPDDMKYPLDEHSIRPSESLSPSFQRKRDIGSGRFVFEPDQPGQRGFSVARRWRHQFTRVPRMPLGM